MKPQDLLKQYLPQVDIMQLSTSLDDQPWTCNIHYYTDADFNFYWLSTDDREHSKQIAQNPKVSAAILVHANTPDENYAIGISVAGTAERLGEQVPASVGQGFIQKHGKDAGLLTDIAGNQNPHKFYRLKPSRIVLFDSKNFPDNPRQEIVV